jgi:hypothetical protein
MGIAIISTYISLYACALHVVGIPLLCTLLAVLQVWFCSELSQDHK